jgi:transcriptional antiterminator NusG
MSDVQTTPATAAPLRWYVVHAYSGMEKAVERNLRERIDRAGMQEQFGRILVPTEEVVEIKNTSKVTGFVGGAKNRPSPISEDEVMKIVNQMQEGIEKPRPKVEWENGEVVRVKEGPFTDFNGSIEDVNYEKSKLRVSVTIFGRATPVELDFGQVEKI